MAAEGHEWDLRRQLSHLQKGSVPTPPPLPEPSWAGHQPPLALSSERTGRPSPGCDGDGPAVLPPGTPARSRGDGGEPTPAHAGRPGPPEGFQVKWAGQAQASLQCPPIPSSSLAWG